LDVWLALTRGEPDERLLAAEGSEQEISVESAALAGASWIVMDPVAILTTIRLSIETLVARRFQRIYVAQAVLDEFLEAEAKSEQGPEQRGRIGRVGDRYFFAEPDPAFENDRRAILAGAIEFVTSKAVTAPCRGQLEYTSSEFTDYERALGSAAISSILLAREHSLPLYSDDLALRLVARGQWAVPAFWSQPLLIDCASRSLISAEEYYALVSALNREHYHFVGIDHRYLLSLMQKHSLALTPEVMAGINLLSDPACSIDSAVNVAAGLVAICWSSSIPSHLRHMVLDAVLGALTQNRSAPVVLQAFSIRVGRALGHQSPASMQIGQIVKLWKRILFS
jgi:hypothetical protein